MSTRAVSLLRSSQRWLDSSQPLLRRRVAESAPSSKAKSPGLQAAAVRSIASSGFRPKPAEGSSSSSNNSTGPPSPDPISARVGSISAFPNEYPGQIYAFNWCLNGDGVTPLKKSAFRITKPLDLKVAGLPIPKKMPLMVKADAASIPEAGSDALSFEHFDEVSQRTRDLLSLSDHLYCPEGHVPKTRTSVRIITNSAALAPDLLAYLERAPRKDPPESLPITAYVLEGTDESFSGYAIEEMEVPVPTKGDDGPGWVTGNEPEPAYEPKSVASVVVVAPKPDLAVIVAGLEASQKALAADELEREAKKEADTKKE